MQKAVVNITPEELEAAAKAGSNVNISVPAAILAELPKTEDGRPILATPEVICPMDKFFARVKYTYWHRIDLSAVGGLTQLTFFDVVPAALMGNFNEPGIKQNMVVWGFRLSVEPQPLRSAAATAPSGWELEVLTSLSTAVITPIVTSTSSVMSPAYRLADAWGGVNFVEAGAAGSINAWPMLNPSPYAKFQRPLVLADTHQLTFRVDLLRALPTETSAGDGYITMSILVDAFSDANAFAVAKKVLRANGLY
jgi:hypothetical protein